MPKVDRRTTPRPPPELAAIRDRLGAASDRALAEESGLDEDVVRYWRRKDGKSPWLNNRYPMQAPGAVNPDAPNAWILLCAPRLVQMAKVSFRAAQQILEDEERALSFLESARWPKGRRCPHCGGDRTYDCRAARKLPLYKCPDCMGPQFNATAGTILNGSKHSPATWLRVLYYLEINPGARTVRSLATTLALNHLTAQRILLRIRQAQQGAARWTSPLSRGKADGEPDDTAAEPVAEVATEDLRAVLTQALHRVGQKDI